MFKQRGPLVHNFNFMGEWNHTSLESSLLFLFPRDEFLELREDLLFPLRPFRVVEVGQGSLLIRTVNLVLLSQTHSFHSPMSANKTAQYIPNDPL